MKNQKTKENGRSIYSWFQGSSSRKQSTPINLEEEEEDEDLKLAIELSLEQQVKEQKAIFEQLERQCAALRDQKRHRHRTSSIHSDNGSDENNDSFETISFRKVKEEKVRESSPGLSDVSSVDIEDISEYLAQCGAPIKPEPGPSTAAPSLSPLLSPTSSPARSPSLSPPPPPPSPPRSSSTCSRQKGKQRASFVRKAHRTETQAAEDQDTHFQQQHINLDEFVESLTIPTRKVYARKMPLKDKEMGSLSGHIHSTYTNQCKDLDKHGDLKPVKVDDDDDDDDCIIIDTTQYSHLDSDAPSINTAPSSPRQFSASRPARTMATAVSQDEERRRKRRRISRNQYNNYYTTPDEDMEGYFDDAGFAANVSTLSWESKGWSHF